MLKVPLQCLKPNSIESVAIMGEIVSEMNMNPTNSLLHVENVHPQSSSSLSLKNDDVQLVLIKV